MIQLCLSNYIHYHSVIGFENYMKPVKWDIWNVAATELASNSALPALDSEFYFSCNRFF